ncbi:MAG: multidrug efflux SMR transporter [Planctomycetota bacterium]
MAYFYLAIAIVAEVAATTALKASDGFTKWLPSVVVVTGYCIAFYCLSLCLRTMSVGISYAIWAGVGIVLVTIAAAIFYKQTPDTWALVGIALIIAGVLVIHVLSGTVSH